MRTRLFRPKRMKHSVKAALFVRLLTAVILLTGWGVGRFAATSDAQRQQIARDAILRAAVQCYAIEARYPPSIQYLADNYGITLDTERYIYHYRATGANLLPEVEVFEKNTQFAFTLDEGSDADAGAED
jgi:hypothetical protein